MGLWHRCRLEVNGIGIDVSLDMLVFVEAEVTEVTRLESMV